ncbi:MAG: CHAD domain-containing protein [Chlorobiaceae bacterium]|nr:CHAD domain-containing protein [Chlorobiaceae bacterium]
METLSDTLFFRLIDQESINGRQNLDFAGSLNLKAVSSRKERHQFYDTFDNDAWQKGMVIVRKKGRLEILSLEHGKVLAECGFKESPASFFAASIPEGKARELLLECSDLRAFSRICSTEVSISTWKILGDNQKTIALLDSESFRKAADQGQEEFTRFHAVTPLKGYNKELARMLRALPEPVDSYRVTSFREKILQIFENSGYAPGAYSSKLRLQLDPDATIHESVKRLLQFTFSIMAANEHGIRHDIDSEFLHDYRVAIRRSRSILRQLRGVFDPDRTVWLLSGLRDLGKRTNQLRDCDVYLLRKEAYPNLLPQQSHLSLDRFFQDLDTEKATMLRQFSIYLAGTEYRTFMNGFQAFISETALPDQEQAPDSGLSTRNVAAKSIRKAWKKVIIRGRKIDTEAADADLHELRIDCKKLRYLLEFFSSILPRRETTRLVGHLKTLQDNLGEFVDLSVQITFILERIVAMVPNGENTRLAASLGALVAVLDRLKEMARDQFAETFRKFDDQQIRELFDHVITSLE